MINFRDPHYSLLLVFPSALVAFSQTAGTPPTFQTRVDLVPVPVVVRNSQGQTIGNLTKDNFQLFDQGKQQTISSFSVEKHAAAAAARGSGEPAGNVIVDRPVVDRAAADRYIAYVFDDIHIDTGDLGQVRKAAVRHFAESLTPSDRAAIFTTSERTTLDFTDDRAKLTDALNRLKAQPIARSLGGECPDISYFQADRIQNRNDAAALGVATSEAMDCLHVADPTAAAPVARAAAAHALQAGDTESRRSLQALRDVVRRMAVLPGQRTIILVSPGFLTPFLKPDEVEVMDRAIRANVTISALDARGLYTTMLDASERSPNAAVSLAKQDYAHQNALLSEDVMADLADGTGGIFFHNSNDLYAGFKHVADTPEYVYMLGFSPQVLKNDGSFHTLKVKLIDTNHLTAQSRRGYYAPKQATEVASSAATAKQDIQRAMSSRDELREIPLEVHTGFVKDQGKLTVTSHIDVRHLRFRKVEDRSEDDLTVVCALFDKNGKYVTAIQQIVQMRLRDDTLDNKLGAGLTVTSDLDAKPGAYNLRVIVRDSEGQQMSATNSTVEVP